IFDSFGDSTLNLILHTFLPTLDKRAETIHKLHTIIDAKFKEAGLEIAFPQRDIHLRSVPPGWDTLHGEPPTSSNGQQEGGKWPASPPCPGESPEAVARRGRTPAPPATRRGPASRDRRGRTLWHSLPSSSPAACRSLRGCATGRDFGRNPSPA